MSGIRCLRWVFILSLILVAACTQNRQQDYASSVLNRPEPKNESARIVECGWLGGEVARQENLGMSGGGTFYAPPRLAAGYQAVTQGNIGVLESRANYLHCNMPVIAAAYH